MARKMPRSFEAAGITYNMGSPEGLIAKILPGRGIMPLQDLSTLGITKQPPFVYDPSRYRTIEERYERLSKIIGFRPDGEPLLSVHGAAISTYDKIIDGRAAG